MLMLTICIFSCKYVCKYLVRNKLKLNVIAACYRIRTIFKYILRHKFKITNFDFYTTFSWHYIWTFSFYILNFFLYVLWMFCMKTIFIINFFQKFFQKHKKL